MFDPGCTRIQIEAAEKTLGFELIEQPLDVIDEWVTHLNAVLGPDSKPKRKLTDKEIRFINHERALCTWNFLYFATRYIWVTNEGGQVVRYVPRVAQLILTDRLAVAERCWVAIYLLILKARQGGISLWSLILQIYIYNFFAGRRGVLASSTPGKTAKFAAKMRDIWMHVPWWLRPEGLQSSDDFYALSDNKIGTFADIKELGNEIVAAAGNQKSSTARGDTWQIAHASELDEWLNPEEDIEASLLNAIHDYFLNIVIVEGTGGNPNKWWPKTYKREKENSLKGISRFSTVFLPWFLFREIHPTEGWLRAHPIPKGWRPSQATIDQARNAADCVRANPAFTKYLGEDWEMPTEQQYCYEWHYNAAKQNGTLYKFLTEWASDDISCFQRHSVSAFQEDLILRMQTESREPKAVYTITGPKGLISEQMAVSKEDYYSGPVDGHPSSIVVNCDWIRTDPIKFVLHRINWRGYSTDTPYGNKLLVWHFPDEAKYYAQGGDACWGRGQDRAVIEQVQLSDYFDIDRQAAEMANPWMLSGDQALFHLAIGTWYAGAKRRQPKIVQELDTGGDVIVRQLMQYGWTEFHIEESYEAAPDQSIHHKFCWSSNMRTRAASLGSFAGGVRDREFRIYSPYVPEEMRDMSPTDSTITLAKALETGAHDDRVLTLGRARFSGHIGEDHAQRESTRRKREEQIAAESAEVDYHTHYAQSVRAESAGRIRY